MNRVQTENVNTPKEWDYIWSTRRVAPHGGFLKILWKLIEKYNPILDVGAGDGLYWQKRFCPYRKTKSISVIDISKIGLEKCKAIGLKTYYGDLNKGLQFKNNSFDLVMATEVIEHLNNPIGGINELIRIAKRRVIVTCPNDDPATNKREHVWQISKHDILNGLKENKKVTKISFFIGPTWSRSNVRLITIIDLKKQ